MHFLYELSGKSILVGMIAPVNESIFEHLKLMLIPMLCWWIGCYAVYGVSYKLERDRWFLACVLAIITACIVMVTFYYAYTSLLGFESIIIDIFDLLLSIAIGQLVGLHTYIYANAPDFCVSIVFLVLIIFVFIVFTFCPPHLPIFQDSTNGKYGI